MAITVRGPEIPDAAGIAMAHSKLWLESYGSFLDPKKLACFNEAVLAGQWHDLLSSHPHGARIAIALEFGRVIGFAMSVPTVRNVKSLPPARGREISLHYLFSEYRAKGYGRRLLEYVASPAEPVQLWLPSGYSGEKRARRIYRSAGFLSDGASSQREENYGLSLNRLVR